MAVNWDVWENLKLALELYTGDPNTVIDWMSRNLHQLYMMLSHMEGERKFYRIREAEHQNDGDGMVVDQWWNRGIQSLPNMQPLNDADTGAVLWREGHMEGRFNGFSTEGEPEQFWAEIDQLAYLQIEDATGVGDVEDDIFHHFELRKLTGDRQVVADAMGVDPETIDRYLDFYDRVIGRQRTKAAREMGTVKLNPLKDATDLVIDDTQNLLVHGDIEGIYDVIWMLLNMEYGWPEEPFPGTDRDDPVALHRLAHGLPDEDGGHLTMEVARCPVEERARIFQEYIATGEGSYYLTNARTEYRALPLSRVDHGHDEDPYDDEGNLEEADDAATAAGNMVIRGTQGFEPSHPHFGRRAAEIDDLLHRIQDTLGDTEAGARAFDYLVQAALSNDSIEAFSHQLLLVSQDPLMARLYAAWGAILVDGEYDEFDEGD